MPRVAGRLVTEVGDGCIRHPQDHRADPSTGGSALRKAEHCPANIRALRTNRTDASDSALGRLPLKTSAQLYPGVLRTPLDQPRARIRSPLTAQTVVHITGC